MCTWAEPTSNERRLWQITWQPEACTQDEGWWTQNLAVCAKWKENILKALKSKIIFSAWWVHSSDSQKSTGRFLGLTLSDSDGRWGSSQLKLETSHLQYLSSHPWPWGWWRIYIGIYIYLVCIVAVTLMTTMSSYPNWLNLSFEKLWGHCHDKTSTKSFKKWCTWLPKGFLTLRLEQCSPTAITIHFQLGCPSHAETVQADKRQPEICANDKQSSQNSQNEVMESVKDWRKPFLLKYSWHQCSLSYNMESASLMHSQDHS